MALKLVQEIKSDGCLYNLLVNICHEGDLKTGQYKAFVKKNEQWFAIQNLFVEEVMPPMVALPESYIQIWERHEF